jgi:hypothetical protein
VNRPNCTPSVLGPSFIGCLYFAGRRTWIRNDSRGLRLTDDSVKKKRATRSDYLLTYLFQGTFRTDVQLEAD